MSAFLCSPQCFRNVAKYIEDQRDNEPLDFTLLHLIMQNQLSLDERYDEYQNDICSDKAVAERLEIANEAMKLEPSDNPVQLHKSACCWCYQSCEGRADQQELYIDVHNSTEKNDHMRKDPAWDDLVWG